MSHWNEEMVARSGTPIPGPDHTTRPAQCGGKVTHTTACFSRFQRLPPHFVFLIFLPLFLIYHSIFFPLVINFFHFQSPWFANRTIELEVGNS